MNYFCNLLYFREIVYPGVELSESGVTPEHVGAI